MRKTLLTLGFVSFFSADVWAIVLNPDSLNLIRNGQSASFYVFGEAPDYTVPNVTPEMMKEAIESKTGKKVKVDGPWGGPELGNALAFQVTPVD